MPRPLIRSAVAFCMLSSVLAGCSQMPSTETAAAQNPNAGILHTDDHLRVLSIDGNKQLPPLLGHFAKDFTLTPGQHTVEFKYVSVWTRQHYNPDQVSRAIAIDSDPRSITFTAEAGHRYHFSYTSPTTREATRELVKDFNPKLVDEGGAVVAASDKAPVDSDTVTQMKSLWQNASPQERQAFLQWAFKSR